MPLARGQQAYEGFDGDFVARMQAGSAGARDLLYRRFSRRVAAYVATLVADPEAVSDVTQDVFVKAFEGAANFHGDPGTLVPWLLVIARNTATDHMRKNARLRPEEPEQLDRRREARSAVESPGWGPASPVDALIEWLPRDQRRVVLLHYRGGMDVAEIGRVLGKSPDAVRHLEHRALASLRDRIRPKRRAA